MATRTVTVQPPVVNVCDILEYAYAAIEEYGWRQGKRPEEPQWENSRADWEKTVTPKGLSLHDAIGYASLVLSGEAGVAATPKKSRASDKDYPVGPAAARHGYHGTMRQRATEAVAKHLPQGETDITFNDKAADEYAVLAVLQAAINEECR